MTDANTEVIDKLNELAEQRFLVELRQGDANQKHKAAVAALETAHQQVLAGFQTEIETLDKQIADLIKQHRKELIKTGKKSFVIMSAKFQFRGYDEKTTVKDPKGIMDAARKLGIVRQIAKLTMSWKFNQAKFFAWLDKHGELRSKFEEFLEVKEAGESLTMAPNSNYTVHHDSKRISPPSIGIEY